MSHPIPRTTFDGLLAMDYKRYSSNMCVCAILGQYALIKNLPKGISLLKLIALFHNPADACSYVEDETSYPTTSEYQLELLVKKDLLSTWNIPFEERNDTTGKITLIPKQPVQQEENGQ